MARLFEFNCILEFENSKGEFFGMARFVELLESIKHKPINKIIEDIFNALNEFGEGYVIKDDASLMGITYLDRKLEWD